MEKDLDDIVIDKCKCGIVNRLQFRGVQKAYKEKEFDLYNCQSCHTTLAFPTKDYSYYLLYVQKSLNEYKR